VAHNITERDGVFAVRDAGWHGLATPFEDYPTREQAQAVAHPWEVESEPLYRRVMVEQKYGPPKPLYVAVPDFHANVRNDTHDLIGVVSETFNTVTNQELWDIAEVLQGEGQDVRYETGGSLKGGRKVWVLLRLNEPLEIKGDPNGKVIPYYGLQNSHDASGAFRGQATMTKIICDNTSQMADLDAQARGTEFTFRHTKNIRERVNEARDALAGWRESVQAYRLLSEHLVGLPVTSGQVAWFVDTFVPMPPARLVSDRVVENVEEARRAIRGILASPTCEGINTTAYGLLQAAVEYQNHYRTARSEETRFKRAYLDRSKVTTDALQLALQAHSL